MIKNQSQRQLTLSGFDWPFQTTLDAENRWVKMGRCIPWDELAKAYYENMSATEGRPAKDARLVIGAVIIKHKLCLSDRETVEQVQENPYLQYFVGLTGYTTKKPFTPSLFVKIRARMGSDIFDVFQKAVIEAVARKGAAIADKTASSSVTTSSTEKKDTTDAPELGQTPDIAESKNGEPTDQQSAPVAKVDSTDGEAITVPKSNEAIEVVVPNSTETAPEKTEEIPHEGKLILDATVAPQAIRYPTDLSLLNEARELTEKIIDTLYPHTALSKKPRTYRKKARSAYLSIVKRKRPGAKLMRRGIKQQLQYLRRNLGHIARLMDIFPSGQQLPLPHWLMRRYWVIQHLYTQQWEMYQNRSRRCDDRIVSISQPYVRPIVRGKVDKPVEFGAKLSVSLTQDGIARVDALRWDAFHEGHDLPEQVEAYRKHHHAYPEVVIADTIYGSRENRRYLKERGIRFAGKPLGRPKKVTEENKEELKRQKAQRREEYLQRIPIEGKFGQGKNGYRLNYIRAKRADTAAAWINSIFLVMNLLILVEVFLLARKKGYFWSDSDYAYGRCAYRFRDGYFRANIINLRLAHITHSVGF